MKDIKELAQQEAEKRYPSNDPEDKLQNTWNKINQDVFTEGAEFGYNLQPQTDWKESTKLLMESWGDDPKDFKYQPIQKSPWIPTSEAMPKEEGDYFVSLSNGQGWAASYYDNSWHGVFPEDVIAWMPIPINPPKS